MEIASVMALEQRNWRNRLLKEYVKKARTSIITKYGMYDVLEESKHIHAFILELIEELILSDIIDIFKRVSHF